MPTVYLTTSQFNENAHLSAEDNGVPNMRIVAVAADRFYRERVSKERARPVVAEYFDRMIASLTMPITKEEQSTVPKKGSANTIKISGDTMEETLENFNDLYLSNHWSDGLPVVAPTPERVKWMLTGTDRSPDEKVGTISPRNGMATIEKIAINAVMAGAKPEYMPVIIAAIEGLADPKFDDLHFATSTGSFNLLIAVSGPIAEEIGMSNGLGMFSYGNRANSSIGRAVRMSIINFGQTWPAVNDMALVGRANPHAFPTFAENQAQSPWTSYSVAKGFDEGDSTVTLSVYGMGAPGIHGGGAVALVPPERIINDIVQDIKGAARGRVMDTPNGPMSRFGRSHRRLFVIFNPEVAQELSSPQGYTRESLHQYIHDASSVPFEELQEAEIASVKQAIASGYIPADRVPVFEAGLKPGGKVPSMRTMDDVTFIVAGGIPGYTITYTGYRDGIYKDDAIITKKITGATLTNAGKTGTGKMQVSSN